MRYGRNNLAFPKIIGHTQPQRYNRVCTVFRPRPTLIIRVPMFRKILNIRKKLPFFLRIISTWGFGYLVFKGTLLVFQHPLALEFKQSSASVWDILSRLETAVNVSGNLFLAFWGLFIIDRYIFRQRLLLFGQIFSKSFLPILKIFTFPFFHGDFVHLFGTAKLTILFAGLFVLIIPSLSLLLQVGLIMFIVQGIGVWAFGRRGQPHVGSSGLMLGFFTFDVLFGILELGWQTFIAFLLLYFFGESMYNTLIDRGPKTSFVTHMWGFASGLLAAYMVSPFGPLSIY